MKKEFKWFKKVISLVLVCTMMNFFVPYENTVYADDINDLEDKIKDIEAQNKELESNMSSVNSQIKDEEATQLLLKEQIINVAEQIDLYQQQIELMEQDIIEKIDEIGIKQVEIVYNQDMFAQRIRTSYITGPISYMDILLSSESFSEFLRKSDVIQRITQSDQQLLTSLEAQRTVLNMQLNELNVAEEELVATKEELDTKKDSLNTMQNSSIQAEKELEATYLKYAADKKANEDEIKKQQEEIDRIIAELASQGQPPADGTFLWPVPSSANISSPYGYRSWGSYTEFHYGLDISAGYGTNIVASNAGTVILAKIQPYTGYGNHVMIDHGGGYVTLYAHASSLLVEVGQVVNRGDVIAKIGSTGNSTGNHLHFEVRINGAYQNPINYVSS